MTIEQFYATIKKYQDNCRRNIPGYDEDVKMKKEVLEKFLARERVFRERGYRIVKIIK